MTGLRPCLWTVLQCKEQEFQGFLGVVGEQAAAREVKRRLNIQSRNEIESDQCVFQQWNGMRREYLNYQRNREGAHAHHHDRD